MWILLNQLQTPSGKPHISCWDTSPVTLPTGPWTPPVVPAPHLYTPNMTSFLHEPMWTASTSLCRFLVSMRRKLIWHCGTGEKAYKWAFRGSVLGQTNRRLLSLSLVLWDWENAYIHKNCPQKENKKCGAGTFLEEIQEASESLVEIMLKAFLSWSQSAKTKGGDCFLNCKDNNRRLQGTGKN